VEGIRFNLKRKFEDRKFKKLWLFVVR
jgi:hypothetical protein